MSLDQDGIQKVGEEAFANKPTATSHEVFQEKQLEKRPNTFHVVPTSDGRKVLISNGDYGQDDNNRRQALLIAPEGIAVIGFDGQSLEDKFDDLKTPSNIANIRNQIGSTRGQQAPKETNFLFTSATITPIEGINIFPAGDAYMQEPGNLYHWKTTLDALQERHSKPIELPKPSIAELDL